jgi:hypothetical protein
MKHDRERENLIDSTCENCDFPTLHKSVQLLRALFALPIMSYLAIKYFNLDLVFRFLKLKRRAEIHTITHNKKKDKFSRCNVMHSRSILDRLRKESKI